MKKEVEVVAAIIIDNDKFLCTQRNKSKYEYISYKYEFPGGKVESGETLEDAIIREIKEELDSEVEVKSKYLTVRHEYPDFIVVMHSFLCEMLSEKIILKEHIDSKWLSNAELSSLDWAEADLPIIKKLNGDIDDGCL
ncbi:(deoxy)nucleoside triphosphate pyrophosphohydrolase [Psychrilyobacter atlanticus]|uniref:(deoxy)nucleoside triphosphate pyrophosphohydrolase n=1 Tax=Psychrilyobacter atlanticus TaxID=271091 RepID=UPI0003FCA40B|nr:(deoxy)nucleoside triphosphate pyrophosphohydrolase [Psychrilyobacter atlanticus]